MILEGLRLLRQLGQDFKEMRLAIQEDVGNRGLARVPGQNLLTGIESDLTAACLSLGKRPKTVLGVVTGFYIPSAGLGETDGPLGAVYLARTLPELGISVQLYSDAFCLPALRAGLRRCGRENTVVAEVGQVCPDVTHLLAIERVGPSHTPESIRRQAGATEETVAEFVATVPSAHHDRCHTMRGIDVTEHMRPVGHWFESVVDEKPITIGIGDGGNEIGMGKVPWNTIRANIPNGDKVACRIATRYLIVAGVSNWGAYALAAGVARSMQQTPSNTWWDVSLEQDILRVMVEEGPLIDGVSGQRTATVDGLDFERYAAPLRTIERVMRR